MKIRMIFKTPDVVDDACTENFGDDQDDEREKFLEICAKFIDYKELITVEVDTETGEVIVVPN